MGLQLLRTHVPIRTPRVERWIATLHARTKVRAMATDTPSARERRLARELRQLRELTQLHGKDVA